MAGDSPLKTQVLQRLTYRAVLPVCTLIVLGAARAAEPPAAPDAPVSGAPAPEDAEGRTDWQDRFDRHDRSGWNSRRGRHAHHEYGTEVVNIGADSNLRPGENVYTFWAAFGRAISVRVAG